MTSPPLNPPDSQKSKTQLIIIIGLAVVVLVGVISYFLFFSSKSSTEQNAESTSTEQSSPDQPAAAVSTEQQTVKQSSSDKQTESTSTEQPSVDCTSPDLTAREQAQCAVEEINPSTERQTESTANNNVSTTANNDKVRQLLNCRRVPITKDVVLDEEKFHELLVDTSDNPDFTTPGNEQINWSYRCEIPIVNKSEFVLSVEPTPLVKDAIGNFNNNDIVLTYSVFDISQATKDNQMGLLDNIFQRFRRKCDELSSLSPYSYFGRELLKVKIAYPILLVDNNLILTTWHRTALSNFPQAWTADQQTAATYQIEFPNHMHDLTLDMYASKLTPTYGPIQKISAKRASNEPPVKFAQYDACKYLPEFN